MPANFFGVAELPVVTRVASETQCEKCKLYKGCLSPKMPASGRGRRKILILAEAPGAEEDQSGIQLVGNSGRELAKHLADVGIDLRRDCVLENALMCRPPDNKIPNGRVVEYCRPHVLKTIRQEEPEVIIPLGATAVESLLRYTWKDEDIGGIGRWAGYRIPDQKLNAWVCPTFHPAHVLRAKEPIYGQLFRQHLAAAADLKGRPWKEVPDYRKQVEVITSPDKAARRLAQIGNGDCIAFDFETNMLKPDSPGARIVCCSVCVNGKETFAFPWHGRAITAAKLVFINRHVRKVGWNVKFETRWCRRFGITVRGWVWDGMLAAHALHCGGKGRPVTGLKFQAYVHLGCPDYDSQISPYLKSVKAGGNEPNRIDQVDLDSLLLYCGMDSLLEYLTGLKLRNEMNGPKEDE